jgi:hypothetical protein
VSRTDFITIIVSEDSTPDDPSHPLKISEAARARPFNKDFQFMLNLLELI